MLCGISVLGHCYDVPTDNDDLWQLGLDRCVVTDYADVGEAGPCVLTCCSLARFGETVCPRNVSFDVRHCDRYWRLVEIDVERNVAFCSCRVREVVVPLKEGSSLTYAFYPGVAVVRGRFAYQQ